MRYKSPTNLEAQWAEPLSLTFHSVLRKLYTEPSIDASYQVSVHLDKRFQRRRIFKYQPISNKYCLWWPCLLIDRNEMSNLYRGPAIDASDHVLVIWPSGFKGEGLIEIDQSETRIACGAMFVNRSGQNEPS